MEKASPSSYPMPGREDDGTISPSVSAYAEARRLKLSPAATFGVMDGSLVASLEGAFHARVNGLIAAPTNLAFHRAVRRERGQILENPFGEAGRRLYRIEGRGRLVWSRGAGRFTPLSLADESLYVREPYLFAFGARIGWENGTFSGPGGEGIPLVHLRGRGEIVLHTPAPCVSAPVTTGASLHVALPAVVAWSGRVLPRAAQPLPLEGETGWDGAFLSLTGEGNVFLLSPGDSDVLVF
jgi:uncharacterized protein (AIM24 family)